MRSHEAHTTLQNSRSRLPFFHQNSAISMASQVTFPSGSSEPTSIENDLMNLPPPESGRDKFFRKMKEQPLVPIGP